MLPADNSLPHPVESPASGHVAPPWRLREFFFATLYVEISCLVWFGTMPNSNSALFVQPYSLWNDAITGYNGACAKVVFTARRHALARSLLSAGVRPSVHHSVRHVRVLYCIQTAEDIKHLSRPGSPMILVFDPPPRADTQFQEDPFIGVQNTQNRLRFWTEIAVYLGNGIGDRPVVATEH